MGNKKRGRKVNPNSKRQIELRKREAKRKAKELEAKLQAEKAEKEALEKEMEALKQQALEAEKLKAELEQAKMKEKEPIKEQPIEDHSSIKEEETKAASDLEKELAAILDEAKEGTEKKEVNDQNVDDLMRMLNEQVTDEKNPAGSDFEQGDELDEDGDFEDDFDEGFNDHNTEPENELLKGGPDLEANIEGENVRVTLDADDFSHVLIDGLDGLMQYAGPIAYKKTAFSKEDRKRLRKLAQSARSKKEEIVLDDYDLELLERFDVFEEYKESLPFTEKEKKNLLAPLKIILQNRGGDLPPGWALVYAATMAMLPRISPILAQQITKQFSHPIETENNEEEKHSPEQD